MSAQTNDAVIPNIKVEFYNPGPDFNPAADSEIGHLGIAVTGQEQLAVPDRPIGTKEVRQKQFSSSKEKYKFAGFLVTSQILFILLAGCLSRYSPAALPEDNKLPTVKPTGATVQTNRVDRIENLSRNQSLLQAQDGAPKAVDGEVWEDAHISSTSRPTQPNQNYDHEVDHYYTMFQNVNVLMIVGIGFLMTFLKKYGYTATAINFLMAAYASQWHTIMNGFLNLKNKHFELSIVELIQNQFCAVAILISMCAVVGKVRPFQYLVMAFVEVIFYTINEYLFKQVFWINDIGSSMYVHVFGAYFGLVVAWLMHKKLAYDNLNQGSSYNSNMFAMIGTAFIWIFYPSFNASNATPQDARHRAVINTYFSLAASTLSTFAFSMLFNEQGKLEMVHIQNAALAGGVAMGSSANLMVTPYGSMIVGSIAGAVATTGFKYLTPRLEKVRLHDTCGAHNLHGLPGIIGGLVSVILAGMANYTDYGNSLYIIFPARDPLNTDINICPHRNAGIQAAFQFVGLIISIGLAVLGGCCAALIMKLNSRYLSDHSDYFNDHINFHTPSDFDHSYPKLETLGQIYDDKLPIRTSHSSNSMQSQRLF